MRPSEARDRSREMRHALTRHEATLWRELKKLRRDGAHFRRQVPFRGYFLDFACLSRRLVIEVDGESHLDPSRAAHDAQRDAVLRREGFRTLRFWNGEIDTNLEGVLARVRTALVEAPSPWKAPGRKSPPRFQR